ncbi:hypothetical protein QEN19_001929 [Hanseniaspora menglaensis]
MPPIGNKKRRNTRGNTVVTTTTTTTFSSDEKNKHNKRNAGVEEPANEDSIEISDPYNGALPIKLLEQLTKLKRPFYKNFKESNKELFQTIITQTDDELNEDLSENKHKVELNKLLNSWEYQYVVSFMYCTFPSFFNKNRERKGYFGKKPIPQPPKLLRDLIASHQSASSMGSGYSSGIRVSARQQQLNLQKEQQLSQKLETINFDGQVEYGPDQRKFHEMLFIQDLLKYIENNYKFEDDIVAFPEFKGDTFAWLVMELAKLYNQDQDFCAEQGCLLKHDNWFSESWTAGDITQKFKILFAVIKFVEIRNIGLRNYINDNMDLFYFPRFDVEIEKTTKTQTSRRSRKKVDTDEKSGNDKKKKTLPETILSKVETQEQFMLMHGGKVVKIIRTLTSPLNLPLKEEHAYTSDGEPLVNFEEKINEYSESIKFDYQVVAFEFDTLMEFNTNVTEFYDNNLEVEKTDDLKEFLPNEDNEEIDEDYTLRQVYMNTKYGLNLFNARMRQHESEAFFNNKKTSKLFIDKISEKNKKLMEEETKEKSQKQKEYLNKANYLRNKSQRIVRDKLIADLWNKYHTMQLSNDEMAEQKYFREISASVSNLKFENYFLNVPYSLIWKEDDLKKLETNDLYFPNSKDVYNMNWIFNCSCDSENHVIVKSPNTDTVKQIPLHDNLQNLNNLVVIENDSSIDTLHDQNIKGDILNCIKCNRWSHYKCFSDLLKKDEIYAGVVAALNQVEPEMLKTLQPFSYTIASMGGVDVEEDEQDIETTAIKINDENDGNDLIDVEKEKEDNGHEKSVSVEETESQLLMNQMDVSLKSPETNGGRSSRRAASSKHIDYTGKSAYQPVEEEESGTRRSSRRSAQEPVYQEKEEEVEELVQDGRPSFLSQFPIGPLENLLKSTNPLTKLLFRGMDGNKAESQEDLDIIYDTLYQRFFKAVCYQCCKNMSEHVVKDVFPDLLKTEQIRHAKNEIAKQKRMAKKQQMLAEKSANEQELKTSTEESAHEQELKPSTEDNVNEKEFKPSTEEIVVSKDVSLKISIEN